MLYGIKFPALFTAGFALAVYIPRFHLIAFLSQIPIDGDIMTAGAMVVAAVAGVYQIKSSLEKSVSELSDSVENDFDKIRVTLADEDKEIALIQQKLSSAIEKSIQLDGRVATLDMEMREVVNWIKNRGGDMPSRTGWR